MTTDSLFCSANVAPDMFSSVEASAQVFRPLPFSSSESPHQKAIETIKHLLYQLRDEEAHHNAGKILLITANSGAGKTHLLRRVRSFVHQSEEGFFSYMQLNTASQRGYDHYILQKVVESFDMPIYPPQTTDTVLQSLSDHLAQRVSEEAIQKLREAEYTPYFGTDYQPLMDELVDQLDNSLQIPGIDVGILRALLYLQCPIHSVQTKVRKYLRRETLSSYELQVLGNIAAKSEDDALEVIRQLALLTHKIMNRVFVVALDQLEDVVHEEDAFAKMRRLLNRVRQMSEMPGVLILLAFQVVSYHNILDKIDQSVTDRIEYDPNKIELQSKLSEKEAANILRQRLNEMYETQGEEQNQEDLDLQTIESRIDPIPLMAFQSFVRTSSRELLHSASKYRAECIEHKRLLPSWSPKTSSDRSSEQVSPASRLTATQITELWEDHSSQSTHQVPEKRDALVELLSHTISHCGPELGEASLFSIESSGGPNSFRVLIQRKEQKDLVVCLCEAETRGGGLLNELRRAQKAADNAQLVLVRSTPFPKFNQRAPNQTTLLYADILHKGGRVAVVQDSDWRKMVALQSFRKVYGAKPEYKTFVRTQRPITYLTSIRTILELDELALTRPEDVEDEGRPPVAHSPVGPVDDLLHLGQTHGRRSQPVHLALQDLKRHTAIVGSSGSGKTNLAQVILEQVLGNGIPVLVLDRKGDLSGYRKPGVWRAEEEQSPLVSQLQQRLDVVVYTPGQPDGQTLNLPLLPADVSKMTPTEQHQVARVATEALGNMMNYRGSTQAQGKKALLVQALKHLADSPDPLSVFDLVDFLKEPDPAFSAVIGNLTKFIDLLALDLEIQLTQKAHIIGSDHAVIDVGELLGKGRPDRHRLTIICTSFLEEVDELLWVSQLLNEMHRWAAKNPSDELQALLFIDEADRYVPAIREPPTKRPLEDLLRRARSAGLGVMLATQNPGDFDYRARDNILTWFVGKLSQQRSIDKLKDVFGDRGANPSTLGTQEVGNFHMLGAGAVHYRLSTNQCRVKLPSQLAEAEILQLAAEGLRTAKELG
ncbi:MAG: DUF853 family protein [Myxococcales bacterium]|nr:DUF853 family protein [Myxococcales bacterium]